MGHPLIRFDASANAKVLARLQDQRGAELLRIYEEGLALGLDVHAQNILSVLGFLKDDPELGFTAFLDITVVDYSKYVVPQPGRFGVIYLLMSPHLGARIKVRAFVSGDPGSIDSATSLYQGAGWAEREAFDFFGIQFVGHPDLKRILMPDNFRDHPLRKEYPLRGRGERADFEVYRAFSD